MAFYIKFMEKVTNTSVTVLQHKYWYILRWELLWKDIDKIVIDCAVFPSIVILGFVFGRLTKWKDKSNGEMKKTDDSQLERPIWCVKVTYWHVNLFVFVVSSSIPSISSATTIGLKANYLHHIYLT